jgi:hypothetical protein
MHRSRPLAAALLAAGALAVPAALSSPAGAAPAATDPTAPAKVIVALDGDLTDGLCARR